MLYKNIKIKRYCYKRIVSAVHTCINFLVSRREENHLDATEWFIALIICSTCFGHLYAHHQELETILVLLPLCIRDEGSCSSRFSHPGRIACCPAPDRRPPATKALHTKYGNNTSIVSSSWWWAYKCPKHVEQIISAINHSVASSWFSSLGLYYDARTNIHQIWISHCGFWKSPDLRTDLFRITSTNCSLHNTGVYECLIWTTLVFPRAVTMKIPVFGLVIHLMQWQGGKDFLKRRYMSASFPDVTTQNTAIFAVHVNIN